MIDVCPFCSKPLLYCPDKKRITCTRFSFTVPHFGWFPEENKGNHWGFFYNSELFFVRLGLYGAATISLDSGKIEKTIEPTLEAFVSLVQEIREGLLFV